MMRPVRALAGACLVLAAGCAVFEARPPSDGVPDAPRADVPVPPVIEGFEPSVVAVPKPPIAAVPVPINVVARKSDGEAVVSPSPGVRDTVPPTQSTDTQTDARSTPSPVMGTPKDAVVAVIVVPPLKVAVPVPAAREKDPPLDVESLKERLRATAAIGVLAKISLRRQMDELLESIRLHHDGRRSPDLVALRKPYDALVVKVLALLRDGDPLLARSIASSREAIWAILVDREKFYASR